MSNDGFNPKTKRSLFALLGELPGQIATLARAELEAFKSELSSKAKNMGVGAGLLAAAAFFGFFAFAAFIATAIIAIALALPLWLSALMVGGALLIIAVVLALVGVGRLKAATAEDPDGVRASIRHDVDAFKGVGEYDH